MSKLVPALKRNLRWVPNTLTLCNSWCGFAAILWTLTAYERANDTFTVLAQSAFIILFAMVFDVLDGFSARLLDAQSLHGIQMDSLSDMVTFGVAPAVLMAVLTHTLQGPQTTMQVWVTFILSALYVGGAALRLATYNVHALEEHKSSNTFHGLPSPGAAAAICSLVLVMKVYNESLERLAAILPIYAAVLGALMISPLPYLHLGKWLLSMHNNQPVKILILVLLLIAVAVFRTNAVFAGITLYVLSGPAVAIANLIRYGTLGGKKE